jgi:hypothetical protein
MGTTIVVSGEQRTTILIYNIQHYKDYMNILELQTVSLYRTQGYRFTVSSISYSRLGSSVNVGSNPSVVKNLVWDCCLDVV